MLPQVENLLPQPRASSESMDYFFLESTIAQVLLLMTLRHLSKVLLFLEGSLRTKWTTTKSWLQILILVKHSVCSKVNTS